MTQRNASETKIPQNSSGAANYIGGKAIMADRLAASPFIDNDVHVPPNWPAMPKPIAESLYSVISDAVVDAILFGLAVAFFAYALIVNSYDGASTEDHPRATERLQNAGKYGPTVFPILFACVLGRATQSIMCWRLEKGERIGVLDTLAGSTSLTSTVTSQLKMRIISVLGIALVAIWALSPVGGQASIRQMTIEERISKESANYTYMSTNGNLYPFRDSARGTTWALVNSLFGAALVGPADLKSSPRDLWGHVKVPMIEPYEHSSAIERDGWYDTTVIKEKIDMIYSSLVGIPLSGVNSDEFIDYTTNMEAKYLKLNCKVLLKEAHGIRVASFNPPNGTFSLQGGSGSSNNYIFWWDEAAVDASGSVTNRNRIQQDDLKPFNFTYVMYGSTDMIQCLMTTTYVEVEISCPTASTCLASRLRRSRLSTPTPNFTQLDLHSYTNISCWNVVIGNFLTFFRGSQNDPSLLDYFLEDSSNPLSVPWVYNSSWPNEIYSTRLGQALNAYWSCAQSLYATTGGLTNQTAWLSQTVDYNNETQSLESDAVIKEKQDRRIRMWPSQGSRSKHTMIIKAHKGWIVTLCFASLTLILASLVPPFIRYFLVRAPDIAMNISGLATKSSPNMALPTNGTHMDSSKRARLLKNVKVRYGDVKGTEDVGSLAIALDNSDRHLVIDRVRKGRLYD